MRFFKLAATHFRIASRQRALWAVSGLLALSCLFVTAHTSPAFATGEVSDLAFLAQMLAILPSFVFAAAFTDLASEPTRLGIDEVEAASFVRPAELACARVVGALSVMALPSAAALVLSGFGQMLHGNLWAVPQSLVLLVAVVAPPALLAAALSALAGSLLPRAVARIAALSVWSAMLLGTAFHPVAVPGGRIQFHVAADAVCQAFFGSAPYLDYQGPATAATPLAALALLAAKLALAAAVLLAASAIAKRRGLRRG